MKMSSRPYRVVARAWWTLSSSVSKRRGGRRAGRRAHPARAEHRWRMGRSSSTGTEQSRPRVAARVPHRGAYRTPAPGWRGRPDCGAGRSAFGSGDGLGLYLRRGASCRSVLRASRETTARTGSQRCSPRTVSRLESRVVQERFRWPGRRPPRPRKKRREHARSQCVSTVVADPRPPGFAAPEGKLRRAARLLRLFSCSEMRNEEVGHLGPNGGGDLAFEGRHGWLIECGGTGFSGTRPSAIDSSKQPRSTTSSRFTSDRAVTTASSSYGSTPPRARDTSSQYGLERAQKRSMQ